ncbi:MAG: hypothetical protein EBS05_10540 [Proteobacteria bacterium]|nr:hypothetical protein [Pseudomonadota bacterium]
MSNRIKDAFGPTGWHLERGILEGDFVRQVGEFLDSRRLRLQQQFSAWVGETVTDESYASHQAKTEEYVAKGLPKDLRHFLRGEFDLETRLDKRIMQVLATPRVLAYLSNFLSSDGYCIHYPPMMRFKMAAADASKLPPHQDWPYNTHMTDFLTVWVPLVTIDEGTGGVVVYEGSHQDGNVQHVAEGSWEAKALADLDKYPQLHVLMNPGDILTFPSELLHASAPQTSSRIRYSIDFRVFRNPEDSTKSFFKAKTQEIVRVD